MTGNAGERVLISVSTLNFVPEDSLGKITLFPLHLEKMTLLAACAENRCTGHDQATCTLPW